MSSEVLYWSLDGNHCHHLNKVSMAFSKVLMASVTDFYHPQLCALQRTKGSMTASQHGPASTEEKQGTFLD